MKKADIHMEDLPEDMRAVAELIGMDAMLRLSAHFGGVQIHIHCLETLTRAARDRGILHEWRTGQNITALARKHNLTPNRIRQIIAAAGCDPRR